ncbi:hypothetical protein BDY24DRAFT_410985 [Mrakia frigida]|uniref:uncharacterized protein n=1 Tax=Mrakia frigida TaxID=29902 RepID=UPI003FCBF0D8
MTTSQSSPLLPWDVIGLIIKANRTQPVQRTAPTTHTCYLPEEDTFPSRCLAIVQNRKDMFTWMKVSRESHIIASKLYFNSVVFPDSRSITTFINLVQRSCSLVPVVGNLVHHLVLNRSRLAAQPNLMWWREMVRLVALLPNLDVFRGSWYWSAKEDEVVEQILSLPPVPLKTLISFNMGFTSSSIHGSLSFLQHFCSGREYLEAKGEQPCRRRVMSHPAVDSLPLITFPSLKNIVFYNYGDFTDRFLLNVASTRQGYEDEKSYEECLELCPNVETLAWEVWHEEENLPPKGVKAVELNIKQPVASIRTVTVAYQMGHPYGHHEAEVSKMVLRTVNKTNFPNLERVGFGTDFAIPQTIQAWAQGLVKGRSRRRISFFRHALRRSSLESRSGEVKSVEDSRRVSLALELAGSSQTTTIASPLPPFSPNHPVLSVLNGIDGSRFNSSFVDQREPLRRAESSRSLPPPPPSSPQAQPTLSSSLPPSSSPSMQLLSPPSSPPPSRHPSPVNLNEDNRAYTRRRSETQVGAQSMIEEVGDRAPGGGGGGGRQRKASNSGSLRGKSTTRTRQSIDRNGARSPKPNLIQRSASTSSRRPPTRITSPPPPSASSSSSSSSNHARPTSPTPSSDSTPRQTNFAFPQPHPQSPLSPVPRRASHLTRPVAGFMTPGTSPNHGFAVLPEHGPYDGQGEGGRSSAPPMRTSFSTEASSSSSNAGSLGVQPSSSPSLSNPDRRPHPSKRSHTSATAARSISYTLPQEPRSSHCAATAGDPRKPCTAESYLRDVLGKAGGASTGGGKTAMDLEEVDLEEEMRKAEETMAEEMVRWADGVGDCPRALVLQEAINASRPASATSSHSVRRTSLSNQPHARHHLHPHQRDVGNVPHPPAAGSNRRYQDQNQHHSPSTPSSPRAVFAPLERRPILENGQTKKRTHSTSSSPSVRSSNLTPLSSSPSSANQQQQQLPSARPQLVTRNSSTSNSSSGPSSTSSTSTGPLPTYHPHFRSPSSRPQRSITCPVQIPASPPLTAHSPTFEPSSLTSIMSSSSLHSPQRSSSRQRPSFGNAGSPSSRTVSQPLVPTRARLGSECKDFDLEASYQRCKDTGGYVSFADVGVGCPFGTDDEEEEETEEERGRKGKGGSWWDWLAGNGTAASETAVGSNKD